MIKFMFFVAFCLLTLPFSSMQVFATSGCLSLEAYGGSNSAADNTSALQAAFSSLSPAGGCIEAGAGQFNFSSEVDLNFPGAAYSLQLRGQGGSSTTFNWSSPSNGLVLNENSQYNSFHVKDMSFTTSFGGSGIGLTINNSANLGILSNSELQNVVFKGSDGGNSGAYWSIGFKVHGASYINIVGDTFIGGNNSGAFNGIGVFLEGGSANSQYGIVYNFNLDNFQDIDKGIIYGSYIQGVTINQTNFQNGNVAVSSLDGGSGVLAQLSVTNSQFGGQTKVGIQNGNAVIDEIEVTNCLFLVLSNANAIDLSAGFYFAIIQGNLFSGQQANSNAIIMGSSNQSTAVISNNNFSNFTTAIWLLQSSSSVRVPATNTFFNVINQTLNFGSGNTVAN